MSIERIVWFPDSDGNVWGENVGVIVRCRDCRHFATNIHGSYCTKSISTTSDPNGYCAWGERRDA